MGRHTAFKNTNITDEPTMANAIRHMRPTEYMAAENIKAQLYALHEIKC